MRVAIQVSTPKQVHIWKNAIRLLQDRGHEVRLYQRGYHETQAVSNGLSIQGEIFGTTRGAGIVRNLELPWMAGNLYRKMRKFRPDIVTGVGTYESIGARLLGVPAIAWNDTEHAPSHNYLIGKMATAVLVPRSFQGEQFGKKQLRFDSYLELAYLHPDVFTPDPEVLPLIGLEKGDRYAVVRFNSWDATHDVGTQGFTDKDRVELVKGLAKNGKVIVSAEGKVPKEIEPYVLKSQFHRMHDILAFSSLYVGDSGTMQNEAAILGVPSVRYTVLPREKDRGNSIDLEDRFGLIENHRTVRLTIDNAVRYFADPGVNKLWKERQAKMLRDATSLTPFQAWVLEEYPRSLEQLDKYQVPRSITPSEPAKAPTEKVVR
jgi:predicted glycosyltransferase